MTERPTVLYLLTEYPAPSHTFIAREITAVEQSGIDVQVLALNPPGQRFEEGLDPRAHERTRSARAHPGRMLVTALWRACRDPLTALRGARVAVTLVPGDLVATAAALRAWIAALFALDHCRRAGLAHIHAHFGQAPASVAMLVSVMAERSSRPITYSITVHGWHDFVEERSTALRAKTARAAFVVCISDFTRSQLMRIVAADDWPKLRVVRCGLDLQNFRFRADRTAVAVPTIITVARLSAEKGLAVLLDATARLKAKGLAVRVRIIGGGPDEQLLRAQADALGLGDDVDFLGSQPIDTVHAELAEAAVFCLPTFAEGLPVSIMEAMASGVPVVTTPISGIPELVVDGVTGDVVAPARPDLVAERIENLLVDDDRRRRITAAARAAVAERHDIAENGAALAELFGGALAGEGAVPAGS